MLILLHLFGDLFAEETINPNIHKSQWIQSWFCKARQYHRQKNDIILNEIDLVIKLIVDWKFQLNP